MNKYFNKQHLFEIFCKLYVFIASFDQFNASLQNKSFNFFFYCFKSYPKPFKVSVSWFPQLTFQNISVFTVFLIK